MENILIQLAQQNTYNGYHIGTNNLVEDPLTFNEPLYVYIIQISEIPLVFLILWLIYKIIYSTVRRTKSKTYTYKALGTCVEIREKEEENGLLYSPVYEIQLNGQTIRAKRELFESPMPVKIGDVIEIQVDPNNPENDYIYSKQGLKDYKKSKKFNPALLLITLFFIVVWIIASIEPMRHIINILQK